MKSPKILSPIPIAGKEGFGKIPTQITGKSLYFHIPFCQRKCPYCHFYSVPYKKELQQEFLKHLKIEWDLLKDRLGKEILSIYFGGGTPSLLEKDLDPILQRIERSAECEITLEANPESLSLESLKSFRKMGINRLSLGVQSFDDPLLKLLKRSHSAKKAQQAIEWAHEAGFDNLSIDLMFDLPTQTLESWEKTLLIVKDLPITHLSLYNLTFEPHTFFYQKRDSLKPLLPDETLSLQLWEMAVSSLQTFGFSRYEISAFAKEGFYSRHNVGYWIGRPFLGLGPSAFSYEDGKRFQNSAHLSHYCQSLALHKLPVAFEEKLAFPQNLQELLVIELRLIQGVFIDSFQEKHGRLPETILHTLKQLQKDQWLEKKDGFLRLSKKGLLFYDSIAETLL